MPLTCQVLHHVQGNGTDSDPGMEGEVMPLCAQLLEARHGCEAQCDAQADQRLQRDVKVLDVAAAAQSQLR